MQQDEIMSKGQKHQKLHFERFKLHFQIEFHKVLKAICVTAILMRNKLLPPESQILFLSPHSTNLLPMVHHSIS
jgi:hypothetical protein